MFGERRGQLLAESAADPGAVQGNSGVGVSVPVTVPAGKSQEKSLGTWKEIVQSSFQVIRPVALIGASCMIGGQV